MEVDCVVGGQPRVVAVHSDLLFAGDFPKEVVEEGFETEAPNG